MAWKDLSYDDRVHLCHRVSEVCALHDVHRLREMLSIPQDLIAYRDMRNGGGILHTLMYADDTKEKSSSVEFLKEILRAYNVEDNSKFKEELFLKRSAAGVLAADFNYVEEFLPPDIKKKLCEWRGCDVSHMTDLTDKRSQGEKNKMELYFFIKEQVQALSSTTTKYFSDKNNKSALHVHSSAHEEYPELKLRNLANQDDKEDFLVLKGLKPDSQESFLSQVIKMIDFPEDYVPYFKALKAFEDSYKRVRENYTLAAAYRYFTHSHGVVVFDRKQDKTADAASIKDEDSSQQKTKENGKKIRHPMIVIDSTTLSQLCHRQQQGNGYNYGCRLYEELFRVIDAGEKVHFSDMKMFQYAMMLAETDKDHQVLDPFLETTADCSVTAYYKAMAAQIMSVVDEEIFASSPLLQKVYQLGQCFAIAKAYNYEKAMKSLIKAKSNISFGCHIRHIRFMAAKKKGKSFELDEKKRAFYEEKLMERIDETIAKMEKLFGDEHRLKIASDETFIMVRDFKDAIQVLQEYRLTEEQKAAIVHKMELRVETYGLPEYAKKMMKKVRELAGSSSKTEK